jgi:hypothetical protein
MTATALGLHQKLEKQYGGQYIGTDEYWNTVNKTMQRRFPEYFGDEEPEKPQRTAATVVASASRSTAPKKDRTEAVAVGNCQKTWTNS